MWNTTCRRCFFVATANVMHTSRLPCKDRMEVLRLHGYTEPEKVEIAQAVPVIKQLAQAGLTDKTSSFTDDAITSIIRSFTREAGVRIWNARSATSAARSRASRERRPIQDVL